MPNKRKKLKIKEQDLWYLVGIITSDGCLYADKRHIDITSKDYDFLFALRKQCGLTNKIDNKYNSVKGLCYHIQFSNRTLYELLLRSVITKMHLP